jgi:hypothetical protein
MSLYCFETFCKASDCAFNATKIAQIDEGSGLSKICALQVKGVMGRWQLSLVCILELKIFGHHFSIYPFRKGL